MALTFQNVLDQQMPGDEPEQAPITAPQRFSDFSDTPEPAAEEAATPAAPIQPRIGAGDIDIESESLDQFEPEPTAEDVAKDRADQIILDQTGVELEDFRKNFTTFQLLQNPAGQGATRAVAGSMLREITSVKDELRRIQERDPETIQRLGTRFSPTGIPAEGEELEAQILQFENQTAQALEELENEYISVAEAAANPTVPNAEGDLVPLPISPVISAIQRAGEAGDDQLVNKLMSNFLPETLLQTLVPSITQGGFKQVLIPGAAAATAKLAFGSRIAAEVAFATTSGAVSAVTEFDASLGDFFTEEGVDLTNRESIDAALDNPELVKKGRQFATTRGLSVALWDYLGARLATKNIAPPGIKNKLANNLANLGLQVGQQGFTGGAGEVQAGLLTEGEIDPTAVKFEVIAEFGTAPVEVVTFAVANRLGMKPEELITPKQVLEAYAANPEMEYNEALELLKESAERGITHDEAVQLLEAFPRDIDPKDILSNKNVSNAAIGVVFQRVIEQMGFEDAEGNTFFGDEITEAADTKGQVFWSNGEVVGKDGSVKLLTSTGNTLDQLNETIIKKGALLNDLQSQNAPFEVINTLTDEIEALKETSGKLQQNIRLMSDIRPGMQSMIREMAALFLPNTDIMVVEDVHTAARIRKPYGSAGSIINPETGKRTQVIYINTDRILSVTQEKSRRVQPEDAGPAVTAVLAHEFGHALLMSVVDTLPPEVLSGLRAEHRRWLAGQLEKLDQPIGQLLGSKKDPFDANVLAGDVDILEAEIVRMKPKDLNYTLGFSEWVADALAKQLTEKNSKDIAPLLRKHLPRIALLQEKFFERFGTRAMPDSTTKTYLDFLRARTQLEAIDKVKRNFAEIEKGLPKEVQGSVIAEMLNMAELDIPQEIKDRVTSDLDKYNIGMRYGSTLLQLAKANKHIPGLQRYVRSVHEHWVTKSTWNDRAMQTINAWRSLPRKEADQVGQFMLERTVQSDELGRALTDSETAQLMRQQGFTFSEEAVAVIAQMDADFNAVLDELFLLEKNRINSDNADFETQRKSKIADLTNTFNNLRNRNYFPLSRFGKWGIAMKAEKAITIDGRSFAKNETIHMELFENKRQRTKAIGKLQRKFGPSIKPKFFKIEEETEAFSGLPASILRHLKDNQKLGLSDEQKKQLQTMIDTMSPTQSIAKRMLTRKGTEGYHRDAARGYANYMQQMSGHIAKIRHIGEMDDALGSIRDSAKYLGTQGIINDKRYEILEHAQRHKDYIMNPVNELGGLRAMAFHWFLGYNVKSALVNLTQVPLVAYPYLAARKELTGNLPGKSDAVAIAELVLAMKDVRQIFRTGGSNISTDEQGIIDQLVAEGIIDESLATELAGQAHGDMITKNMPRETAFTDNVHRGAQTFLRGSTKLFQMAEKFNRRATALAAIRLAKKQGMTPEIQLDEAREALRTTQFEYARWNRAAFMRGKTGVLFVFMQYLQNVMSFVIQDPGRWRYLGMMIMMAGLQGLPGAEDLLDLFDFASRTWKKNMQTNTDPRSDIRESIRNMAITLDASPELMMHGLSAQSFGLGLTSVNDMLGTSIPALSFEGSISAGRIVPGWEALMRPNSLSGSGAVEGAKDILGAAITIPLNMLAWTRDEDPSEIRAFERMAPSVIKGGLRAFRGATEGELTDRGGKRIIDFDMTNPEHIAELIAMPLGIQPTRLARAQEARWAEREATQYYATMRQNMQLDFNYAMELKRKTGDDSGVKEVRKTINWFNRNVPKGQAFTTFGASYARFRVDKAKDEAGVGKRFLDLPVQREIRESFPAATEERIR